MNVLTSDKKMSLVIMPTEKCNFKCKYCYETFKKGKWVRMYKMQLLTMKKKILKKKLIKSDSRKVALYASVSNENCQCCNTAHPC